VVCRRDYRWYSAWANYGTGGGSCRRVIISRCSSKRGFDECCSCRTVYTVSSCAGRHQSSIDVITHGMSIPQSSRNTLHAIIFFPMLCRYKRDSKRYRGWYRGLQSGHCATCSAVSKSICIVIFLAQRRIRWDGWIWRALITRPFILSRRTNTFYRWFLPRGAMLARYAVIVCQSVCLSVCHMPVLCQNG